MILHKDKMTIKRAVKFKDEFGGTFERYEVVAEGVACHLSQKNLREVNLSSGINSSRQDYKIFTSLEVDVKQNDLLEVVRPVDSSKYYFKASKPMSYEITKHKEILVSEVSENEILVVE